MAGQRRVRLWPAITLATLLGFLGIWAFVAGQHRLGLSTGEVLPVERTGSAEVRSCARDPLYLWATWTCAAEVRWDDDQVATVPKRVLATHELTGTVAVLQRETPRRTAPKVVPADYPARSDGALFFVMMLGLPGLGIAVGLFTGFRLARLLPEPPERKLTFRPTTTGRRRRHGR